VDRQVWLFAGKGISGIHLLGCASNLPSSWSADPDSSTLPAIVLDCTFKRHGVLCNTADTFKPAFSQIQVFEILQVFPNCLAGIVGFCAPPAPGEALQAFLNRTCGYMSASVPVWYLTS
jgi:hypothetical protein